MKKVFIAFPVGIFLSILAFVWSLKPLSGDTQSRQFTVNQGDGLSLIASRLESQQLIRHRFSFILWSYLQGLHRRLQAGSFSLASSMSVPQMVLRLSTGGSHDYWLKIIGGSRLEELDPKISSGRLGYLFPDNYLIPQHFSSDQILAIIYQNFDRQFLQAKSDSVTTLSDAEVVILASLVEREARLLPTKQIIAGILLNRLQIGMALQVDATVQYAKDNFRKPPKYWQPINRSDLKIVSAYNTYLHPGLPPGPICNPGYDSLYAVFHPTPSDYLYYITDNHGQMHYARTLEEHNANVATYLR